jgi:endonuclease YncB( thermonuclease family)
MRRPRRLALVALLALAALAAALWERQTGPPVEAYITGHATVHDADTITVAGGRIRLDGIDAPELAQTCERAGVPWPCGRDAAEALRAKLRGQPVRCAAQGRDRFNRLLAHCWLGEMDIGGWLVSEGLAVAYTRYSWRYAPEELAARWHGRGLWGGSFETPEDWRRRNPR